MICDTKWYVEKSLKFFEKTYSEGLIAQNKKKIDENWTVVLLIITTLILYLLSFQNHLNLGYFSILFFIHLGILLKTRFNETNPRLPLLFFRHYESMICYFLPFLYIAYILTILTEYAKGNSTEIALIFVKFALIIYFWVLFSSIPFLGIYFSVSILTHIVGITIRFFPGYDPPVVLYFFFFLQFLWGLGYWYSHTHFMIRMIRKKEDLGILNNNGRGLAVLLTAIYNIIGIWILFNEQQVFSMIKTSLL